MGGCESGANLVLGILIGSCWTTQSSVVLLLLFHLQFNILLLIISQSLPNKLYNTFADFISIHYNFDIMHHFATTLLASTLLIAGASAKTVAVDVGKGGQIIFSPAEVKAEKGDTVEFTFTSDIPHNVVAGDFSKACAPSSSGGFYSGELSKSSKVSAAAVFTFSIRDALSDWGANNVCVSG